MVPAHELRGGRAPDPRARGGVGTGVLLATGRGVTPESPPASVRVCPAQPLTSAPHGRTVRLGALLAVPRTCGTHRWNKWDGTGGTGWDGTGGTLPAPGPRLDVPPRQLSPGPRSSPSPRVLVTLPARGDPRGPRWDELLAHGDGLLQLPASPGSGVWGFGAVLWAFWGWEGAGSSGDAQGCRSRRARGSHQRGAVGGTSLSPPRAGVAGVQLAGDSP